MPARIRPLSLLVASIVATTASTAAFAQSVIVGNGSQTNKTIPLDPTSTVQIDTAGNLLVTCALTAGVCTPLAGSVGGTPLPGAPTSSFARNDNDSDLRTGDFVRFNWSSTLADACVASSTAPGSAVTSWVGVRGTSDAAGEAVTLSVAGDYTFSFQCLNASGGSVKQTINVTAAVPDVGTPPAGCTLPPDNQLQPAGWTRVDRTWVQTWSSRDGDPVASYPQSVGFPVPVGSDKGKYVSIPFVPIANQVVGISWEQVQSNGQQGYPNPRPAEGMYFSISPCPGDFRRPDTTTSSDGFLQAGCRRGGSSNGIIFHTLSSASSFQACQLQAGLTYYLNVIAANPEDGLGAGEHSCGTAANSANGCDVQATHRPTQ